MDNETYKELKILTAKLYALCNMFWPDEFNRMYQAEPKKFRDWLNCKTGLDEDHTINKITAIKAWVSAIDHIVR